MADLTKTDKQVRLIDPSQAEVYDVEAAASGAPAIGESGYFDTAGRAVQSDAGAAGTALSHGIVVKVSGRGLTFLKRGRLGGFDLSGLAFGDPVYLSDTAGALADAAGTVSIVVGTVVAVAEAGSPKKALYIDAPDWSS